MGLGVCFACGQKQNLVLFNNPADIMVLADIVQSMLPQLTGNVRLQKRFE
jgi:hypothetical protein